MAPGGLGGGGLGWDLIPGMASVMIDDFDVTGFIFVRTQTIPLLNLGEIKFIYWVSGVSVPRLGSKDGKYQKVFESICKTWY